MTQEPYNHPPSWDSVMANPADLEITDSLTVAIPTHSDDDVTDAFTFTMTGAPASGCITLNSVPSPPEINVNCNDNID